MGKRYLVSRLSSLGDVVCTLPVAAALKAAEPDCHITWAVSNAFAGVVECCEAVDEVRRVKIGWKRSTWPAYAEPFDVALDMQGLAKSALCIARAKAGQKLGYHWQREGSWLFSARVLPDASSYHIVDQYVDVARAAGGAAEAADFAMSPDEEDLATVKTKLGNLEVSAPFVVLNPGAAWATKRWPPANFAALADSLSELGIPSVLIGGSAQADRDSAQEVASACKSSPASLVGQTSIRELIALLSLSQAHVGGDTGSTHIAAALGKPAIGLYSITQPLRSCPYGQIDRCHYNPGGLSKIPVDDVFKTVREAVS